MSRDKTSDNPINSNTPNISHLDTLLNKDVDFVSAIARNVAQMYNKRMLIRQLC